MASFEDIIVFLSCCMNGESMLKWCRARYREMLFHDAVLGYYCEIQARWFFNEFKSVKRVRMFCILASFWRLWSQAWAPPPGGCVPHSQNGRGRPSELIDLYIGTWNLNAHNHFIRFLFFICFWPTCWYIFPHMLLKFRQMSLKVRSQGHVKWPHLRKSLNARHSCTDWTIALNPTSIGISNSIDKICIS